MRLPFGGATVPVEDLVAEVRRRGGYMIVGAANAVSAKHPKPDGLDMWLRKRANGSYRDVRQATAEFLSQLCTIGPFELASDIDPQTGRICKSIRPTSDKLSIKATAGLSVRVDRDAIRAE